MPYSDFNLQFTLITFHKKSLFKKFHSGRMYVILNIVLSRVWRHRMSDSIWGWASDVSHWIAFPAGPGCASYCFVMINYYPSTISQTISSCLTASTARQRKLNLQAKITLECCNRFYDALWNLSLECAACKQLSLPPRFLGSNSFEKFKFKKQPCKLDAPSSRVYEVFRIRIGWRHHVLFATDGAFNRWLLWKIRRTMQNSF